MNGKIIYPSGVAEQITYDFPKNPDFGHQVGYLETDDNVRAFDGTLNSYAGARKKTFELTFTRVLKSQLDYFQDLWAFQCPMDLYLDGVNLDATVKIMTPPSGTSEAAFVNGEYTYSFDLTMEQV
jgi:hypothetical protein